MRCIGTGGVALATLALVGGSPAGVPSASAEELVPSGSITYTWHGDAARGCASHGLCGVRGEVIEYINVVASMDPGHFFAYGPDPTARVEDDTGNSRSLCVDATPGVSELDVSRHGGRLSSTLKPSVGTGRCAGPLSGELARLRLPAKRFGSRDRGYDLRGIRRFGAGPFTGTVRSTLVFRPTPSPGGQSGQGGGSGITSETTVPLRGRQRSEVVELSYRLTVSGALDYSFAGAMDPSCEPLAACGATGDLSLAPGSRPRRVKLEAYRHIRVPVGRQRALADFRRGRLGALIAGTELPARLTERVSRGPGAGCADGRGQRLALLMGAYEPPAGHHVGRQVPVQVGAQDTSQDLLRTHCAGPEDTDVVGPFGYGPIGRLVAGSVTTGQLLATHADVGLSRSGSFVGPGYAGTRGGRIVLHLTLLHVKAGTEVGRS